jgi:hypothetical protein
MGRALRKPEYDDVAFSTNVSSTSEDSTLSAPAEPRHKVRYDTSKNPALLSDDVIQEAVRNHLRYLRSAGKIRISAYEVARSLDLSVDLVKKAALQVGATLED